MIGDEIVVLRSLEGAAYRARRDAVIARTPHLEVEAAPFVDSPLWTHSVTARMLVAHAKDAALHAAIEEAIDKADVAGAQRTASGLGGLFADFAERTRVEWGEGALPLAWESLLKRGGELPPIKLLFHLAILRGLPTPLSVEVLLAFMESRDDEGMIEATARALATFPSALVDTKVAAAYRRHDLVAGALQRLRVDIHYAAQEGR
jgi:hypothetical protein